MVKAPGGSAARLSDPAAVRPSFKVDVDGDYVFSLTARTKDGDDRGASATTTVSTRSVAPVADAGLNRRVALGATVALDGARSFDADGDAISYQWTLARRPRGSGAVLSSATAVRPTLKIDVDGTYVAQLRVLDAGGKASAPATVVLSTRASLDGRVSAGPAQLLTRGATARLDADGTYLPHGTPPLGAASWTLLSRPANSSANLKVGPDARQAVTIDLAGDYVAQIVVPRHTADLADDDEDDDDDEHSDSSSFNPGARAATALLTTANAPPVAHAGDDQLIAIGAQVSLDGARSTDVNGDLLSYRWALISKPAGSAATLDDPASVAPKFTADVAGDYVAQLLVDDGFGHARPATVVVSTKAAAPMAHAGKDALAQAGASVTLDGSASRDSEGGTLAATWSILGLGDQAPGTLSNPAALVTNLAIPPAGARLIDAVLVAPVAMPIADGTGDDIKLASLGRLTANGSTKSIWRIRNPGREAAHVRLLPADGPSTSLDVPPKSDLFVASASTASHKLAIDGDIGSAITASATAFSDTRRVPGAPFKLAILQLSVANRLLFSNDDVVVSTIEARPVAVPALTSAAYRGAVAQLDGAASLNPNLPATPNGGLTYKWSLLSRPATSRAQIGNQTSSRPTLKPDAYGRYVVQLIVSDGVLDSRPRTVAIVVSSQLPVALIDAASPVLVAQTAAFDGSRSIDPDGNALRYAWSLKSTPPGSRAAIGDPNAPIAHLTPDVAGAYTAQLVVSDAYGASTPATATILAQGGFAFTPVPPQTVPLGASVSFSVQAQDASGKPVSYSYPGSLPAGAKFDLSTGAFSFRPPSNDPASYLFTFQATNGKDVATMSVPVTVTGAPDGATASLVANVYDALDYANGIRTPVVGAAVSAGPFSATSSAAGAATLSGLPAGTTTLAISARNAQPAPDGSAYLDTYATASLIAGVSNTLDAPILLARATGSGTPVNAGADTVVRNDSLGVSLTIPSGSAHNADGTPYTGQVSIGALPSNTPIGLPEGFAPCQLLSISPVGVTFDPPAQLTVADADHLPPGAAVDLWAFDQQFGAQRVVGIGKVAADGSSVSTVVGGVPGGSVVAMAPRRTGLDAVATQPLDMFTPSVLGGGDLATSFSPPGSRVLNAAQGLAFVYHSSTADAHPVLDAEADFAPGLGLPQSMTTRLSVDGVTQSQALTTNLSKPLSGGALDGGQQNRLLQAGVADATGLQSGAHRYSFLTLSRFACSTVSAQKQGTFVVNNQTKSAFGAGWQLAELQKLEKRPDGTVASVEGNGRVAVHSAEQAPDFLPDPVYIPVAGPYRGAVGDFNGDGRPGLVRLGYKDGSLVTILNRGARQFVRSSVVTVGQPGSVGADGTPTLDVTDVAASDINNDGTVDVALVTSKSSQAKVFFGATGGTFLPTPIAVESNDTGGNIAIGDWIGAGVTHLMMSEGAGGFPDWHMIINDGRGGLQFFFSAPRLPADSLAMQTVRFPGFMHDSVVGVTSDGTIGYAYGGAKTGAWYDNAWSRGVGDMGPWRANTPQDFDQLMVDQMKLPSAPPAKSLGRVLSAGDIDASGQPAFAVAAADAIHVVRWRNAGAGNQYLRQTLRLPGGLAPDSVTLAPLANGNRPSLIVTARAAGFYVFLNDGRGNFATTPVRIDTPFRVGIEADVVDFDGDGVADIAVNDIDNDRVAPGQVWRYFGYDALQRLRSDSTALYSYYAASNLTYTQSVENGAGYVYQYDEANRPTGMATLGYPMNVTFGYDYDALSRRIALRDNLGGVTRYAYDAEDRVTTITTPWGRDITQTYDSAGRPSRTIFPNGLEADLSFEARTGRLASVAHLPTPSGAPILKFDHAYDIRGNLSALTELAGTKTFSYDKVERLTGAAWANPPQQIESYSYDPEGNRIASHISAAYVTDDADRVLEDDNNTYAWSPYGELTRRAPKGANGVAYDFSSTFVGRTNQMRLDAIHGSDGADFGFGYDPYQRLVFHRWPQPRGNDELYYDGPDAVLERRHLASGEQWVRYVHGPQDDQPLAMEVYAPWAQPTPGTGSQSYYHADGEGSIRMVSIGVEV